jgi:hypothetical protein
MGQQTYPLIVLDAILCPVLCVCIQNLNAPCNYSCYNESTKTIVCSSTPLSPHFPRTMPVRSRRSRDAKKKRLEGCSGFVKRASAPSPDRSVYSLSDTNTDASTMDTDSSSGRGRDDQAAASMEGLQRLYSVFLPPHLQLNEARREKRQKVSKRSAVYTRDSRTTAWRRKVAQGKAAKGCTTLDGFIKRKVSSDEPDGVQSSASHHIQATAQPLTT